MAPLPSPARGRLQVRPPALARARRTRPPPTALPPDAAAHVDALAAAASHLAVLGYERVVMPCQNMGCGDVTYRR